MLSKISDQDIFWYKKNNVTIQIYRKSCDTFLNVLLRSWACDCDTNTILCPCCTTIVTLRFHFSTTLHGWPHKPLKDIWKETKDTLILELPDSIILNIKNAIIHWTRRWARMGYEEKVDSPKQLDFTVWYPSLLSLITAFWYILFGPISYDHL